MCPCKKGCNHSEGKGERGGGALRLNVQDNLNGMQFHPNDYVSEFPQPLFNSIQC